MCYAVYLASDRPLPLIPWDANARGFNVEVPDTVEAAVRRTLDGRYIALAGTHTCCACGFNVDPGNADGDVERAKHETRTAVAALRAYLEMLLEDRQSVEVFVTWYGEESRPVVDAGDVTVAWLCEDFVLPEQTRLTVRRS